MASNSSRNAGASGGAVASTEGLKAGAGGPEDDQGATGTANKIAGVQGSDAALLDSGPTDTGIDGQQRLNDEQAEKAESYRREDGRVVLSEDDASEYRRFLRDREKKATSIRTASQDALAGEEPLERGKAGVEVAPTQKLDHTIPGGLTKRADGSWQNAHGQDVNEEGTVLDTERNRENDPVRRGSV